MGYKARAVSERLSNDAVKSSEIVDVEECGVKSVEVAWWDLTKTGCREEEGKLTTPFSRVQQEERLVRCQLFCRN